MGCVVPTMPTPPRPQRARACCEYCRREIAAFSETCAGCGAPHRTLVIGPLDLIDCTTLEDAAPRFVAAGLMTRNEARALMVDETFRH